MEYSSLKFGEILNMLRVERNLSAVKLAKEIGVGDTTILRWEKGVMSPTIDKLYLICKYFGVTPNYLLGFEN